MSKKISPRAPSQTVGPFFHNGLKWTGSTQIKSRSSVKPATLFGKVYDAQGETVRDCMIEFWMPNAAEGFNAQHRPFGLARVPTDSDGVFRVHGVDAVTPSEVGGIQYAPHLNLILFARGLLTPVFTRVFFSSVEEIKYDPVIVAAGKRASTLIAKKDKNGAFEWDIHLQGERETVFLVRD